jgi:major membrane immunogen (membrane-anchored lipoprotein)
MRNFYLLGAGFVFMVIVLIGCSAGSSESSESAHDQAVEENVGSEYEKSANEDDSIERGEKAKEQSASLTDLNTDISKTSRMVIYNALIEMEVKNFKDTQETIQKHIDDVNGYIVESNSNNDGLERSSGHLTARVPRQYFQQFIEQLEKISVKIHNQNISGQDVTEEYKDLESRLKAKRAVEERLLQFMKEAKTTKDLLDISDNLANVQEEIEQIVGKMKYLENQSSLSTVTIHFFENKVVIPDLEKDQLNTWEKIKKQFMDSINFLLIAGSGLLVFFIGNSPILILFACVSIVGYLILKRIMKNNERKHIDQ